MPDPVPPDVAAAFESARARLPLHPAVHYFLDAGSTNDIALALADTGAPEGTIVLAERQTAGRGRRGRAWFSPAGAGIYLSCVVRFDDPQRSAVTLLSLAAGLATANAITATTGLPLELKWPNDVVVGRPWRKLAGILCESSGAGDGIGAVVVGIGVNVQPSAYPPELSDRATSVEVELGRAVDRGRVAAEIVVQLLDAVRRLRSGDEAAVLEDWRRLGRAGLADVPVRWHDHGEERRGHSRGIDRDGALLVRVGTAIERVIAGEVTWERLS